MPLPAGSTNVFPGSGLQMSVFHSNSSVKSDSNVSINCTMSDRVAVRLIVNEEAAVIEGHEVYSTGGLWCTVQDLCTHHGASSMIVVGL